MHGLNAFYALIEAYREATGLAEATVSSSVLKDGKGIARLRAGKDIGTLRLAKAVVWLDEHWPEKAKWPANVERPSLSSRERAA